MTLTVFQLNWQNAPIFISIMSLIISIINSILTYSKMNADKLKEKSERDSKIGLGVNKIRELIFHATYFKNINPKNLSHELFRLDKELFLSFFILYEKNENIISSINPIIPSIFSDIKIYIKRIEEAYDNNSNDPINGMKMTVFLNYYYLISSLCTLSQIALTLDKNYIHPVGERGNLFYFESLKLKFQNYSFSISGVFK